jgi:hypothetical protein
MPNDAHAATPDVVEAMWASIQHGVHNRLSLKQAYRQFAMGQDPSETEEEFEARWRSDGRPLLLEMKAEEDRWLAMTDEERETTMQETATRHGLELTPHVRALTLQMRQGRVDLLRDL